jgi:hypothetical protein
LVNNIETARNRAIVNPNFVEVQSLHAAG